MPSDKKAAVEAQLKAMVNGQLGNAKEGIGLLEESLERIRAIRSKYLKQLGMNHLHFPLILLLLHLQSLVSKRSIPCALPVRI